MDLKSLLSSLKDVAGSRWALIGDIAVIGAWVVRTYVLAQKPCGPSSRSGAVLRCSHRRKTHVNQTYTGLRRV
jgi:hypothetical protein